MSNDRPRPISLSYLTRNRVRLNFGLVCKGSVMMFAVLAGLFASFIWVRSYWEADTLYYYAAGKGSFFSLASSKGSLGFVWDKPNPHFDNGQASRYGHDVDNPWDVIPVFVSAVPRQVTNYRWGPVRYNAASEGLQITVSDWFAVTLVGMFPAFFTLILVRRRTRISAP